MIENSKIAINNEKEREVFRTFATLHPVEAAECNWQEFVAMVREVAGLPEMDESIIRNILKEVQEDKP